jgi:peptidoglycan-N-acetylglucosamine deacetylase
LLSALIFVAVLGVGSLYVFWAAPLWFLPVLEWLSPGVLFRVRIHEPLVALSFDDGPHPEFTPRVLEILQRHQARATFFLIGERAARYPVLVDAILAGGHEVGNHCWRDGPIVGFTDEEFAQSLEQTERALQRNALANIPVGTAGSALLPTNAPNNSQIPAKLFRAPGGVAWPRQWRLARQRGYRGVLGCAYPHDPIHPPIWYMRWLINKNLRPGTIVILHDGIKDPSRAVAALPAILERGRSRRFQFVSVGELLIAAGEHGTDK